MNRCLQVGVETKNVVPHLGSDLIEIVLCKFVQPLLVSFVAQNIFSGPRFFAGIKIRVWQAKLLGVELAQ